MTQTVRQQDRKQPSIISATRICLAVELNDMNKKTRNIVDTPIMIGHRRPKYCVNNRVMTTQGSVHVPKTESENKNICLAKLFRF